VGSSDHHPDAWVGCHGKIHKSAHWRIRLNLQNVGAKNQLVPAQYEPAGDLARARVRPGMGWRPENSFDFRSPLFQSWVSSLGNDPMIAP